MVETDDQTNLNRISNRPRKKMCSQWEFQDPKMEVLYHIIRPYFVGIFPYIALTLVLYMVGTSSLSLNSN